MAGINQASTLMAGVINEAPTVFSSATLGTTVAEVLICAASLGQMRRIQLTNASATNLVAWTIRPIFTPDASVTMNATLGAANCGSVVLPGQSLFFAIPAGQGLYIVGSDAATQVIVSSNPV